MNNGGRSFYYFAFGIIFRGTKFSSNLLLATEPTIQVTEQPSNTSQGNSNKTDVLIIGCTVRLSNKIKKLSNSQNNSLSSKLWITNLRWTK